MTVLFANNATATLASGISSGATAIALTTGQGALFPAPTGGDYFYATLVDAANNIEIVKCTARSGDTLTVARAQQSTTAKAYLASDRLELRVTAGALQEIQTLADGSITTAKLAANAVDSSKLADNAVTLNKIPNSTITAAKMAAGAAEGNLGFTPARQGSGDDITFTWNSPKIDVDVNGVDQGQMLFEIDNGSPASGGYRGNPQVVITSPASLTIPLNSAVAFGDGIEMTIVNFTGGNIQLAPTVGVNLFRSADGSSGVRTLAHRGRATLLQGSTNNWLITGEGIS
jgi:hypothetical protein